MSFGKSGGSAPVFDEDQRKLISEVFAERVNPAIMGGAPDLQAEMAERRARQGTRREFAHSGLSGSGLEARAISKAQVGGAQAREANLWDLVQMAIAPLGQAQKGGFKIGLTG
jgi:hypothetical protein